MISVPENVFNSSDQNSSTLPPHMEDRQDGVGEGQPLDLLHGGGLDELSPCPGVDWLGENKSEERDDDNVTPRHVCCDGQLTPLSLTGSCRSL